VIEAEGISVAFGGVRALDGVTLHARPGEILGIVGPNGSGKSTLLDVLCGARMPDAGAVRFHGHALPLGRLDAVARAGVGRTFQIPRLAQRLTVIPNLLAAQPAHPGERLLKLLFRPGMVRRTERAAVARAVALLSRLGLARMADAPAGSLSGGQQKLLGLGVAVMSDPRAVLLDEPAAGVNAALIESLVRFADELKAEGRVVVLVEHNMDVIARICDRVIVLDGGRTIMTGTPNALRADAEVRRAYLGG
jgi:ABC-type branched-subunit amino acid transport system ATPase component